MTKTISFINYKGGVGKTTTAYHIGCALALYHNKKVLLVDVDPQTNLTFLCVSPQRWEEFKSTRGTLASLYRAFLRGDRKFDIKRILWSSPMPIANLDLIPSDIELLAVDLDLLYKLRAVADPRMRDRGDIEIRTILARALVEFKEKKLYDFIIIDCPPNLYLVTQNALFASDYYIVTVLPDHLSTIGLNILYNRIQGLKNEMNKLAFVYGIPICQPVLAGIIFVRVRLGAGFIVRHHSDYMEKIRNDGQFGALCFRNFTTEAIGYGEAAAENLPVFMMKTANARRIAEQYLNITEEFLDKVS
ncbi:MAG: AAA family ATPase [Nitrososphaeria archaeon]